jgi:hypothetical protein
VEPERRHVARADQHALEPMLEATGREGEEDVQEDDGRQQIEREADGVRDRGVRPSQARQEDREARGDHQRAEAAVGPPRPGDDAGEDVRQRDPIGESGLKSGLGHVIAGQREPHQQARRGAAGQRDAP